MAETDRNERRQKSFQLLDGDVAVWIEQESIHLRASERQSGDPVELTADLAKRLAAALLEMADALGA
jgi:hypothetical protein